MSFTALLGVAILVSAFLVIAFKLDEEHGLLRLAFILLSMGLLLFVPAAVLHSQEHCEVVVNDTTYVYGNNFTGYHWDYDTGTAPDGPQVDAYLFHSLNEYTTYCYNSTGIGVGLVKAIKYPYWLFIAYLVVYLFYRAALALGASGENGRLKRFFRGFK